MLRLTLASSRTVRFGLLGVAAVTAFMVASTDTADARKRQRHRSQHASQPSYNPKFASIIVDGKSGAVLQATNADAMRHPASLTKIMTLYMLFERIEAGKIGLDTEMEVSVKASQQSPTKLGLRPGQTLRVEDAIKGLVTRSANDAAVVIAEAIAGDEAAFAQMMTRKARALGMTRTVYRNASGLPNDDQITTARDQATLGRAIQERFPRYYRYFSTVSFNYRGRNIRNHNRLLGQVEGIDGIKTGYIRASGFNLVSSIRRGNRHLVGVVLGGRSAASRDATMRGLLAEHIDKASTRQTVAAIVERNAPDSDASEAPSRTIQVDGAVNVAAAAPEVLPRPRPQIAQAPAPVPVPAPAAAPQAPQVIAPQVVAAVQPQPSQPTPPAPMTNGVISSERLAAIPGSSEPIKPVRVRTLQVRAGQPTPAPQTIAAIAAAVADEPATSSSVLPPPAAETLQQPANHGTGNGILGVMPSSAMRVAHAGPDPRRMRPGEATQENSAARPAATGHSGWMVQVGALQSEQQAKQRLEEARSQAQRLLNKADPFTETVGKGSKKLYRARFAGLDRSEAEAVCRTLRRSDISCITLRN